MYTRQPSQGDDRLHIPDNYRGNAFHGDTLTPSPPIEYPQTPPVEEETTEPINDAHPTVLPVKEQPTEPVFKKASPFSSLLPPRLAGTRGGLLGDIGIEELVIIGVLILLSQSETDDDILLLLVLLLFYK
jgi:hypothetical protein